MKVRKNKKKDVAVSTGLDLNYDTLLQDFNGDPFDFLTSLKKGKIKGTSELDPDSIGGGKSAREGGVFNEEMLSKEVDISKMVREVLDENSMVPKDVKIDDGDMPLAKNFYEWTTEDHFAGTVMTPYLEQLIWGIVTFGEWCPRCSDNHYLLYNHGVADSFDYFLKKVCLLENGVCPACKGRKSEFVRSGEMPFYQELAVCAGQRSGKSAATGGMLTPYMTHRILKMQKPNDVYGIAGSTMLHGTFCALTYAQAKETLWEFYYGTLIESEWFKNYHAMLRFYENRFGQQLLKFNDTFVVYRPRSLMFYPAGPDKRVLRGRTRIFAGIDEIGYFDNEAGSNKVKTSARHVYDALDASLLTIRGSAEILIESGFDDILTGYSMNVSSPSSQRDKICELVRQAEGSESMYGVHRPTWEVNPTIPRNSKVVMDAYKRNPVDAEKNFGASPPLSANPFISNEDWVIQAHSKKKNRIKLKDVIKNRKKKGTATKWAEVLKISRIGKASMLCIDAGYSNNSFAIAVGHMGKDGKIIVDLLAEVMPEPGIPLNYTMIMEEVLDEIIPMRNVQVVLADRWNSLKILSDIEANHDIVADQFSMRYKDLCLTKSFLESGMLSIPKFNDSKTTIKDCLTFDGEAYPKCFKNRSVEHLVMQILTVQDSGNQVVKGDGLTDDLWRAMCLLVWGLTSEKYIDYMEDAPEIEENSRPTAIAVSRQASGGSKQWGNGGQGGVRQGGFGVMKKNR